jgi:hypothetical protein
MNYIKEIFLGKPIDYMHAQFIRYSKGTFQGPTLVIKNGSSIKADGSIHYANILGEIIVKNSPQEFNASGTINAKREIKIPMDVKKKTKKSDLHTVEVKETIHSDGLQMIYSDYKDANILLELNGNSGKWKLKCKKKLPKPGGGLDEKFCSAVMEPKAIDSIMDEILFDIKDKNFKEAEIRHELTIEELVGSPELKKDAARFRTEAKRKGKIKRTVTVDGRKTETTTDFIA